MRYLLLCATLILCGAIAWVFLGFTIGRRSRAPIRIAAAIAAPVLSLLAVFFMLPSYQDYTARSAPREILEEIEVTGSRASDRAQPAWRTSARNADDGTALDSLGKDQVFDLQVRFALVKNFSACPDEAVKPLPAEVATIVAEGVKFDLVLLADDQFFEVPPDQNRKQIVTSFDIPVDVCDVDDADGSPAVQAASVKFRLKSRDRRGRGTAAVVIYRNGRPVDQIPMTICVDTCSDQRPIQMDKRVDDYLTSVLEDSEAEPPTDASLYVFDLSDEHSAGVVTLRKSDSEFEYVVWPIQNNNVQGIRAILNEPYSRVISETLDPGELAIKGRALSDLIFERQTGGPAREKLESFLLTTRSETGRVPSLFVRIADRSSSSPLIFPAGLLAMNSVNDGSGFLGRHAQIVMPLPKQSYRRFDECSSNIYTVFPDSAIDDAALKNARSAMGQPLLERWMSRAGSSNRWSSMSAFYEWLVEDPEVDEPSALFLLSHHQNGSIRMHGLPSIEAEQLAGLRFTEPSWVVLNGCASAGATPSGTNFIRRFNESGVQAIVATHAEVPANLAGNYYRCLDEALATHKDSKDYLLGAAHFDAVECLWNSTPSDEPADGGATWGPNALKYVLLGNPNLRACPIEPEPGT